MRSLTRPQAMDRFGHRPYGTILSAQSGMRWTPPIAFGYVHVPQKTIERSVWTALEDVADAESITQYL